MTSIAGGALGERRRSMAAAAPPAGRSGADGAAGVSRPAGAGSWSQGRGADAAPVARSSAEPRPRRAPRPPVGASGSLDLKANPFAHAAVPGAQQDASDAAGAAGSAGSVEREGARPAEEPAGDPAALADPGVAGAIAEEVVSKDPASSRRRLHAGGRSAGELGPGTPDPRPEGLSGAEGAAR